MEDTAEGRHGTIWTGRKEDEEKGGGGRDVRLLFLLLQASPASCCPRTPLPERMLAFLDVSALCVCTSAVNRHTQ